LIYDEPGTLPYGAHLQGKYTSAIDAERRVGIDHSERIKADPRGLAVTYYTGEKAPCPCIADGVMLATNASPGQGTLVIAPEKAPAGMLAVVDVRNRKTGEGFRYTVADAWLPRSSNGTRPSIRLGASTP
jgi:hypothetical protein